MGDGLRRRWQHSSSPGSWTGTRSPAWADRPSGLDRLRIQRLGIAHKARRLDVSCHICRVSMVSAMTRRDEECDRRTNRAGWRSGFEENRAHLRVVARPALVNGAAGVVITVNGRPVSVMGFTVTGGKIVAIDAVVDPVRLRQRGLSVLDK